MVAFLHLWETYHDLYELSNMIVSSLAITLTDSLRTLECILSYLRDFCGLSFF